MKYVKTWLALTATALAFGLSCGNVAAQPDGGPGPGRGPGPGMMNLDPQQMQQMQQDMQKRILEYFRKQMVVTNDVEWGVVETRLSKVMRLKMEVLFSGMGMMGGMRGGFRFPGMGEPAPEAEALQKAVENNAPSDQIKSALARFRESRKRKEAELAKAQAELCQVLTVRQEAVLVAATMLE
jgi:hypothetical protein